jgi:hypothetical protein
MFEDLIAKFQFWKARKFLKFGRDYDLFLDLSNKDAIAIKIIKKYPGVIFEITDIHMSSDNTMSYNISIIANPNLCNVESNKFKDFTSAILRNIITESVELEHATRVIDENGNIDLVESDAERVFHEEDTAISEERVPDRKPRKKGIRRNKRLHSEVQQSTTESSTGD